MIRKAFVLALSAVFTTSLLAQSENSSGKDCREGASDWKEKVRAEKVEFITKSLQLTEDEADLFWPVYDEICNEKAAAIKAVHEAYFSLKNAVYPRKKRKMSKDDAASGSAKAETADVLTLLKAYTEAQGAIGASEAGNMERLLKVLPVEKVAKLYVAEENFRRQQIDRLGGRPGGQPGPGQPGPGQPGQGGPGEGRPDGPRR